MHIVVPYNARKPWPFKRNSILFLYQKGDLRITHVYFPITSTTHRLEVDCMDYALEKAIADFVQYQVLAFVLDEKNHEDLAKFFVETPAFGVVYPTEIYVGLVTIEISPLEVSP